MKKNYLYNSSSPITKAKLRKVPPMPYEFWTNILAHKMTSWFKVYHTKHKDSTKVCTFTGQSFTALHYTYIYICAYMTYMISYVAFMYIYDVCA